MPAAGENPLEILIIHESRVIRRVLTGYVRADHPEARVDYAADRSDLDLLMEGAGYDLILCGSDSPFIDAAELAEMCGSARLVALAGEGGEEPDQRFAHRLPIPCTSTQFREMLYRVFVPAGRRARTVYRIPGTRAFITFADAAVPGGTVPADIRNISSDTVVCILPRELPADTLAGAREVTIRFPADYGKASTIRLTGRLEGVKQPPKGRGRDAGAHPLQATWRVVWNRFELDAATKKPLVLTMHAPGAEGGESAPLQSDPPESEAEARERLDLLNRLERMAAEREGLHRRIRQLEARLREAAEAGVLAAASAARSVGIQVNQPATPSADPRKREIFKRIVADNIRIRAQTDS